MVFTSATFLVFLAIVFGIYWSLPGRRAQNVLLIVAGYAFYSWWDYRFCTLMIFSTIVDYLCGRGVADSNVSRRKWYLVASLMSNLGLLALFKYFNFFQDSLIGAFAGVGVELSPWSLKLALPIGISFYTFQTLSYTIDIYRGHIQPHRSFVDYAAYVCFFPQLVAGPIERASALLPQFADRRVFDDQSARNGLRQMVWGFFKKMVLADRLALVVNEIYAQPDAFDSRYLWLAAIGFGFQIYCDFSAYSDIAIGTAKLFGIRLTRNFATPYFSQDFVEFWRRWHISLSTWFRDYVYIPLGGSRVDPLRQSINILIVFAVSGLWHGAGWNFVTWGVIHGIVVVMSSRFRSSSLTANDVPLGKLWSAKFPLALLRCLIVLLISAIAWVFFRVESPLEAWSIVGRMLVPEFFATSLKEQPTLTMMFRILPVFLLIEFVTRDRPHPLSQITGWPKPIRWLIYAAMIWTTMYYMPNETGEFVYFQF